MPDGYKPAKPFSNGSEAEFFMDNFCNRCTKRDRCVTKRMIDVAWIDNDAWHGDFMVREDAKGRHVCIDFFCSDPRVMSGYENTFPQLYIGYRLKNLSDGYVAIDEDGKPALRCGSKENLETMLLVVHADKMQSTLTSPDGKDASTEEKL